MLRVCCTHPSPFHELPLSPTPQPVEERWSQNIPQGWFLLHLPSAQGMKRAAERQIQLFPVASGRTCEETWGLTGLTCQLRGQNSQQGGERWLGGAGVSLIKCVISPPPGPASAHPVTSILKFGGSRGNTGCGSRGGILSNKVTQGISQHLEWCVACDGWSVSGREQITDLVGDQQCVSLGHPLNPYIGVCTSCPPHPTPILASPTSQGRCDVSGFLQLLWQHLC